MIKGVNKKIIEINSIDSLYFEKAIFYIKPNVLELPGDIAKNEAERYIELSGLNFTDFDKKFRARRRALRFAFAFAVTAVGVGYYFLMK